MAVTGKAAYPFISAWLFRDRKGNKKRRGISPPDRVISAFTDGSDAKTIFSDWFFTVSPQAYSQTCSESIAITDFLESILGRLYKLDLVN